MVDLPDSILFLSNGHAEDTIAAKIAEKLQEQATHWKIIALPLVGQGLAWDHLSGTQTIGPKKILPSGGFAGFNLYYLTRDIFAGWLKVFKEQLRVLRGLKRKVRITVCVGDVLLIVLASLFVRRPIIFFPTAKSVYAGAFKNHYLVEKWLIKRFCCLVFPRDERTTVSLQKWGIKAYWVGNPMLDCLEITHRSLNAERNPYVVGILPGSRQEAYHNLSTILAAVSLIDREANFSGKITYLLALAPSLKLAEIKRKLARGKDWSLTGTKRDVQTAGIVGYLTDSQGTKINVIKGKFGDILDQSRVVIGVSGMANEQVVGLGKPLVSFPGKGPQITRRFLQIQQQLIGGAVFLVKPDAEVIAEKVCSILTNPGRFEKLIREGRRRMGKPGATERIANVIGKTVDKLSD